MNQSIPSVVPEYIVAESVKTPLTEKQLVYLIQGLIDQEVDSVVLSKQLTHLADMSSRIAIAIRDLRQQVEDI